MTKTAIYLLPIDDLTMEFRPDRETGKNLVRVLAGDGEQVIEFAGKEPRKLSTLVCPDPSAHVPKPPSAWSRIAGWFGR